MLVQVRPPSLVKPIQKPSPVKSFAAATAFIGLATLNATDVSSCGRGGVESALI